MEGWLAIGDVVCARRRVVSLHPAVEEESAEGSSEGDGGNKVLVVVS